MTNRQTARKEAGERIKAFNTTNAAQLATIPDYVVEETEFNQVMLQLKDATPIQQQDNTGNATEKELLRQKMAACLVKYSKRGVIKASRAGNTVLEHGLDHSENYYMDGSAQLAIDRAIAVKDLIKNNLATITSVTAADVTLIETAIADFEHVKGNPTATAQAKKLTGTTQVEKLLDRMDVLIGHMGYLVDSYFAGTSLQAEFELKAKLIILGTRSNTVTLHIQDATTGLPIAHATATNTDSKKTDTTDTDGIAFFETMRNGTRAFTIAAAGYITETVTVKVVRSTNTEVVVKMGK